MLLLLVVSANISSPTQPVHDPAGRWVVKLSLCSHREKIITTGLRVSVSSHYGLSGQTD